MVEQQRALLEEHSVSLPTDLSVQYQEAAAQQRKLALQVTAEKQLPLISKVNIIIHSTFWNIGLAVNKHMFSGMR